MIQPPYLQQGNKIAIISTARKVSQQEMQPAIDIFTSWGLEVVTSPHLFAAYHQFAGTDSQRASDLQWAIDQPDINAIVCARGGYGTARIIDSIDFSPLLLHPKWIAGFSDVTTLLCHLQNKGIESMHSIMPILFDKNGASNSVNSLKKALMGEKQTYTCPAHPANREGKTIAPVVGGNLSILHNLIGTASNLDTNNKILFLEDLDEYLYHIDRMINHMKRAGKFDNLAGLIVGHFTDMKDNQVPFGQTPYEIIAEAVKAYNYPVCFGFPVGHSFDNVTIICGRQSTLEVTGNTTRFEQSI